MTAFAHLEDLADEPWHCDRRNPARELGARGLAEQQRRRSSQHEKMLAVTQKMRREMGLPEDRRLIR